MDPKELALILYPVNYQGDTRRQNPDRNAKLREAFLKGAASVGWISVEDGLPETQDLVLSCKAIGGVPVDVELTYYNDGWWTVENSPASRAISHWMPLPKIKVG